MMGTAAPAAEPNFRVAIRVRPLNGRENRAGASIAWKVKKNIITCTAKDAKDTSLPFDNIFGASSDTGEIYDQMAKGVVESCMGGIHGTVFAYGQTSSGKTHTMMGSNECPGVIPRAVADIFSYVRKSHDREFLLRVSYLEIYQECIRDLFKPDDADLKIHEHPTHGFYVKSTEVLVESEEQILALMDSGEAHRHVGQTNMNEKSSRSHTIFRITVESKLEIEDPSSGAQSDDEDEDQATGVCIRHATLNLVDLAGSERVGDTGAAGVRLKEAGNINKSLLTLGNVIKHLAEGTSTHIPYRDSKLTKILQPALGGNGKTSMICAVTPSSTHIDETRSTLLFANRAKNVKNSACVNEVMDDKALLLQSKKQVAELQKQLSLLQEAGAAGVPAGVSAGVSSEEIESLLRQKKQVEADNEALAKIVVDEASEKQKLNNKLTHMSAMLGSSLMGNSVASTVSRRASNPVAPTRRITFGNYSVRAEGKNRLSVLHRGGDRPLLDLTKSIESTGDDGDAFSKVKTFIDYQPSAAWEDDNDDRDLGVLEEFEEMEEEEQEEEEEEETVELGHSNLRQSIEHQSERIKDLESQLHDREREIAVLKQSEQEVDGQSYERLQEEVETLRDEANGKQREIEHFEHEYSRVVSESKDISTKMQEMEKQVQDTAEQSSKMDELQATLTEYKLKIASAAQSPVTVPASSSATVTTAEQAATIDRLERDRYDLKLAMKDKSAHLQAANGDLKTAETEFKASQIEMAELRSSLQQAVSAANADAEQRQHEAADHANACKGMEEQLASLRLQVEQLTAEREASVDAKTKVQEQAAQSAIQITQLQESVSELRDSNAMAKKELKEQAEELKRERALHKSEGKSAGSDASKLASMEFKFKSLLQEKNTLGKEKAAAQRETRELKNQMEKLQATVDKADASTGAKKLRLKLDEVMPQLQETKRVEEALREQYQASDKQCTAMQVALREVQIELASCQTDKEAAETRAAESAEQLAGVRVEMQGASESSKSEADELRQQLQTLSSTMETQKGSEMQRVSDEMAELNLTLQSNATQLDAALAECSVMQADIAEKDTLLTAVASELEEKEQLETEMDSTRVKLRQAEARLLELEQASQVHSEMASRLARAATESAAANERVQASESETARLQESHKAAENTIVDLRSSLQMVEAEHVALIEIQHSGEQRQSEVDQLLKAAAQEKEEMVAKVAEMELIATDAVAEVEIKQIELEQLRERYKTLCAQPVASPAGESKLREQKLHDTVTELTQDLEMLEDDKVRLLDLLSVKEKMVADERGEREALESKLRRITSKVKSTRSAVEAGKLAFGGSEQENSLIQR